MPDGMSHRMPDNMPEDMPDRMPEDMSENMPEDMPGRMPEDMPDKIPEDMPDRMPEDMPDRMPDKMSDRMPENLPVTKYINVMVGITRSKVISIYLYLTLMHLCREVFTHRSFYTEKLLNREAFTHTQALHAEASTHKLYTEPFSDTHQPALHKPASTQTCLYPNLLWYHLTFTCSLAIVTCKVGFSSIGRA